MGFETLNETEWARVDRVWQHLDDGEPEAAREALEPLRAQRGDHPDVRVVEAAVLLEEGEAADALRALEGAERSADPALYFYLRGLARFDLLRFAEARDDARRALAVQPRMAEAHDLASRALEYLGDETGSRDHATAAAGMDPDRFPVPLALGDVEFDALVERSVRELPERVRQHLDEVPLLVQPLPAPEMLRDREPPFPPDLLGLFVGRDLFARGYDTPPEAPGTIFLFRRNLLRMCRDRAELEEQIRVTVQHEVGHLLGLDEDDLDRWGLA